jgi:hypothetical protein
MDPKYLVKTALKCGLDGIAVTDHNTLCGGIAAKQYETPNFEVIVGAEINTDQGEVIGLYLSEEIVSRKFSAVISEIRNQNGVVIIPHPFDTLRHSAAFPKENDACLFDGIEGFNSRCLYYRDNQNAQEYAKRNNLCITAGSDAHFENEVGNAGITVPENDLRDCIYHHRVEIFGKKTLIINPILTKGLKIWRKINSG